MKGLKDFFTPHNILGLAAAIFGFLELNLDAVKALIPHAWRGATPLVIGLAVIVLTYVTKPHDQ